MGNPLNNFIEPILCVIPPPRNGNIEGMIATYAKMLDSFSDEALEMAAENMIRTMKTRSMPLPGECIKACREAAATLELRKRSAAFRPRPKKPVWTPEDTERADHLFASHWGQRAVTDGVELALWDFMASNKRWPNKNEYLDLKGKALTRRAAIQATIRGIEENGKMSSATRKLIATMDRKIEKLRSIAAAA